jgi:hypothetical protein
MAISNRQCPFHFSHMVLSPSGTTKSEGWWITADDKNQLNLVPALKVKTTTES